MIPFQRKWKGNLQPDHQGAVQQRRMVQPKVPSRGCSRAGLGRSGCQLQGISSWLPLTAWHSAVLKLNHILSICNAVSVVSMIGVFIVSINKMVGQ